MKWMIKFFLCCSVISVKVDMEPSGVRTRALGYVSFDNPLSAQYAIAALDGLHIRGYDPTAGLDPKIHCVEHRILKVTLKS